MKLNCKKFFVGLILIIVYSSCLKNTNIIVEKIPPKIVLHGYNQTAQPFRLNVGKSMNILDIDQYTDRILKGADIFLYANDVQVDRFQLDSSGTFYTAKNGTQAQAGVRFKIKASKEGFAPVESEAFLSDQVPVILSSTIKKRVKKIEYEEVDEVRIRIADPPGVENYYVLKFLSPYYYDVTDTLFYYSNTYCIYTNDPDIDNAHADAIFSGCISGDLIVSDKNFDGKEKEFVIYVPQGSMTEAVDSLNERIYRPILQLYNITADEFKYKRSIRQYKRAADNPFAEPVSIFTNVRNGFGLFSITHIQSDTLR